MRSEVLEQAAGNPVVVTRRVAEPAAADGGVVPGRDVEPSAADRGVLAGGLARVTAADRGPGPDGAAAEASRDRGVETQRLIVVPAGHRRVGTAARVEVAGHETAVARVVVARTDDDAVRPGAVIGEREEG